SFDECGSSCRDEGRPCGDAKSDRAVEQKHPRGRIAARGRCPGTLVSRREFAPGSQAVAGTVGKARATESAAKTCSRTARNQTAKSRGTEPKRGNCPGVARSKAIRSFPGRINSSW